MSVQEPAQPRSRTLPITLPRQVKAGLPMLRRQLDRLLRAPTEHRRYREDHRPVRVAHVPRCPLSIIRSRGLRQVIVRWNDPVLSQSALRAPTTVGNPARDRPVQRRAVCARLSARDDLLQHDRFYHKRP